MNSLKCLVILSACGCLGVNIVDGIRVPSSWNEVQDNSNGRNIESNGYHRFNVNRQQRYGDDKLMQRRNSVERELVIPEYGNLYNRLKKTASSDFFGSPHQPTYLSQGEIFILSDNNQDTSTRNLQNNELPAHIASKYPDSQLKSSNKQSEARRDYVQSSPLHVGTNTNNNVQAQILGPVEYGINQKYHNAPNDVLPIVPISTENLDSYRESERAKLKQPTVNQLIQKYNPEGYKKYTQRTFNGYNAPNNAPSAQSLNQHVPQNHKFIISASEEHSSPTPSPIESIEFTTKKEPLFFVTEGYRNVLVQGPNKKRKYQGPHHQNKDESKRVINTENIKNGEADKPSRRRKVTKIYKIHGNNGEKNRNVGGYNSNLIDSRETGKQKQYFQRPNIYRENDRRAGFRNHLIKNYRDDTLHEPVGDYDVEREVNDKEKIDNDDEEGDEDERNEGKLKIEDDDDQDEDKTEVQTTETENDNEDESDDDGTEEEGEEVPHSEHADPEPVPTKPIYPGEGAWAKKGVKHRPYISQHRFLKPQDADEKPDGHDVFEDLEKYFEKQNNQFGIAFGEKLDPPVVSAPNTEFPVINPPNPVNPIIVYDPFSESTKEKSQQISSPSAKNDQHQALMLIKHDDENGRINQEDNEEKDEETEDDESDKEAESDEEENDEFVPIQLYTQVRKSENEEHEPHDPLEHGRLREVIKDSKIQTVYTEEGYEDSAYDHAGHEKKAEEDQGHEEFEREKFEKLKPSSHEENDSKVGQSKKSPDAVLPLEDSVPSDSIFPSVPKGKNSFSTIRPELLPPKTTKNNNFVTTQEVKTTQVKDKKNGDVQLEIQSEVKVIVQPNNSTKAHKYVKIYPKVFREYSMGIHEGEIQAKENSSLEPITDIPPTLREKVGIKLEGNENTTQTTSGQKTITLESNATESNINSTKEILETTTSSTEYASPKVLIKAFNNEFDKVASTEQPIVKVKILDDEKAIEKIDYEFKKLDADKNRRKRSIDDIIKEVDIDIGFVDKINHTFAPKLDDLDLKKYPYYTRPDINENSPLRYAEDMKNIPVKKEGELSFYKMADKHECPEIPQNIDPIPEHVKNSHKNKMKENDDDDEEGNEDDEEDDDENEESDDEHPPTPKTPRIELGDKIECLKLRYFGDNPLDSPIFREETVGPVKPIFKELERKSIKSKNDKTSSNSQNTNNIVEHFEKFNEIFNGEDNKNERKFETDVKDKVYNALNESVDKLQNAESIKSNVRVPKSRSLEKPQNELTEAPLITLITTPKYTIQLTPKNIYDQIKLLDHLPEEDEDTTEVSEASTRRTEENAKNKKSEIVEVVKNNDFKDDAQEHSSKRQPKILTKSDISNRREEKVSEEDSPEAEALRRRRYRPRRPTYQIFDVNRFLPTTAYPIIQQVHSTVLPKSMVKSEVYYKDEIKPSEQLNVFADVLNNIKNSSKNGDLVQLQSASNFAEPSSVTISTLEGNHVLPKDDTSNIRVKKYQSDSSSNQYHRGLNSLQSSTEKHYNARYPVTYEEHNRIQNPTTNRYIPEYNDNVPNSYVYVNKNTESKLETAVSHPKTDIDESELSHTKTGNRKVLKRRRRPSKGTTSTSTTLRTTTNINVPKSTVPSNHQPYVIDYIEDTEGIVGLVPPSKGQYKTIVEDSAVDNTNEAVEQLYEYKTIEPSTITEPITGHSPAPVTELNDELPPPVRTMNNYYFLGLKPPLAQRARPYTEFTGNNNFVNNNVVKRRIANYGHGRLRLKREAARTYSEVSRNRGSQYEGLGTTPAEDIDDYVPHRPTNFHYDEKTGKIVYHKKPQEEREDEEEEEYEEIEIPDTPGRYLERAEDATHPTPKKATTKPLLATATPPPEGKGLLDYVAKLKNNPSYQYIPDPTTPDPESAKTTTESSITVDPKSTNPPEFLNILAKVKSDNNYKFIEDPKESKSKSKTTTPEPEDEEYEDDEEDDDEEENIRNSPGEQGQELSNIQIFDVNEYIPKVKQVSPKTTIDYSKYKTIERPHVRHNMSSRYNSEEQPNLEEVVTVRRPIIMEERESIDRPVVSKEKIGHNKEDGVVNQEATTQRYVQFRRGTRPTTQKTTAQTAEPIESVARRSTNRRRPVPSTYRVTRRPTTTTQVTEATEKVERIYPQNTQTESSYFQTNGPAKRVYRRRPVRIRHTTERQEENDEDVDRIARRSLGSEFDDVPDRFDREYIDYKAVEEAYDEVKDEIVNKDFKTENRILKNDIAKVTRNEDDETPNKQITEFEDKETSESNKKEIAETPAIILNSNHGSASEGGGNYQHAPEEENIETKVLNNEEVVDEESSGKGVETYTKNHYSQNEKMVNKDINEKDVEIFNEDFDKTKKHGGNYKRQKKDEDIEIIKQRIDEVGSVSKVDITNEENPSKGPTNEKDVEVIDKEFDKSQKHGGNYRREEEELLLQANNRAARIRQKDAKAFKNINAVQERSRNDDEEAIVEEITNNNNKKYEVEIVDQNFDSSKKHGGNYISEHDAVNGKLLESEEKGTQTHSIPQYTKSKKVIISKDKLKKSVEESKFGGENYPKKAFDGNNDENGVRLSLKKKRTYRINSPSSETSNTNGITRLTDVVPKPDHFYSDTQLPKQVNKLKADEDKVRLSSEELEQITQDGDIIDFEEPPVQQSINIRRNYSVDNESDKNEFASTDSEEKNINKDGGDAESDKEFIEKAPTTKKPLFIKDPSKRLYFYVPA